MRTPVYARNQKCRIISMPNGLWVCQAYNPEPKKNQKGEIIGFNVYDPWFNTHRPTTKSEALRQLGGT